MRGSSVRLARSLGLSFSQAESTRRQAPSDGRGDVNGDGVVDQQDVQIVNLYLQGNRGLGPGEKRRADVDGDGQVTTKDRDLISDYINGGVNL